MKNKIAFLFAGQGSQFKEMGLDFVEKSISAKELFNTAKKEVSFDLEEALKNDLINETKYTQPLTFITSAIIYNEVIKAVKPDAVFGFSLGEFSAFYAANILSFADTLKVINKRATLMSDASSKVEGSMAAIIGLNSDKISEICNINKNNNEYVGIANYNNDNQTVITGSNNLIEKVSKQALEDGAKRAIKLNVSGPFHSPYMESAGFALSKYIKNEINIYEFTKDIWLNTSGRKMSNKDKIFDIVAKQICSPVLFKQAIKNLKKDGYNFFIEIGPGKVLKNLIRKIDRSLKVISVNKYEDLDKLKELE